MKTLPAGMQEDLDSGSTKHCHCWRLVRTDGVVLGFTDHDNDLRFGGLTYEASSGFTASAIEQGTGLNVDNMDVTGALKSGKLEDAHLAAGLWDNARITVFRVDWTDVSKRVIIMRGSIGEVSRGSIAFSAEVRSLSHELNQPTGRIYTSQCDADLFDNRCTVSPEAFTKNGTVDTVISSRSFTCKNPAVFNRVSKFFDRGLITWNTGNNAGFKMEVKSSVRRTSDTVITLWELMPFDIEAGDTFTIQAGCDKSIGVCNAKFNNVINFRGFPRIPGNDRIQYYARKDGDNDGGSLWD
jgi:uncharacterized phage protein (TIGR02218 family)